MSMNCINAAIEHAAVMKAQDQEGDQPKLRLHMATGLDYHGHLVDRFGNTVVLEIVNDDPGRQHRIFIDAIHVATAELVW